MIDIKWDDKFSVGHDRIDHEHRIFIDLIRNVSCAEEDEVAKERVIRLLMEVKKYAEFHFYSEENLMLYSDYAAYAGHKKEHLMLLSTFDEKTYNYRVDAGTLDDVVEFLFSWFALHTTQSDRALVEHLNSDLCTHM